MSAKTEVNFPFAFVILMDIGINILIFKTVRVSIQDAILAVGLLLLFEIFVTLFSAFIVSLAARGIRGLIDRF